MQRLWVLSPPRSHPFRDRPADPRRRRAHRRARPRVCGGVLSRPRGRDALRC
jgi:hypothetical protein